MFFMSLILLFMQFCVSFDGKWNSNIISLVLFIYFFLDNFSHRRCLMRTCCVLNAKVDVDIKNVEPNNKINWNEFAFSWSTLRCCTLWPRHAGLYFIRFSFSFFSLDICVWLWNKSLLVDLLLFYPVRTFYLRLANFNVMCIVRSISSNSNTNSSWVRKMFTNVEFYLHCKAQ